MSVNDKHMNEVKVVSDIISRVADLKVPMVQFDKNDQDTEQQAFGFALGADHVKGLIIKDLLAFADGLVNRPYSGQPLEDGAHE